MKTIFPVLAMGLLVPTVANAQNTDQTEKPIESNKAVEVVEVLGTRKSLYTEITENTAKLVDMPGALGDPLGAISALPGVITPVSGGAPAVRGSSPSDNRYYIDGLPAGYIFHEFNTSVLDENVVQDFQLYPAGFGAQYADATGAIFDVRLRDPKHQNFASTINLSFLRAGVFVEGEVTEDSAMYFSMREGMLHYLLEEEDETNEDGFRMVDPPEDRDYQFKYQWDVSHKDRLTLTLAGAEDGIEVDLTELSDFVARNPDFEGRAQMEKGFDTQGLHWAHNFKVGAKLDVRVAHFEDAEKVTWGQGYFLDTTLDNDLLQVQVSQPMGKHWVTVGGEVSQYTFDYDVRMVNFVCTEFDPDCQEGRGDLIEDQRQIDMQETTVYVTDSWQVTRAVNLELGLQNHSNDYTDERFTHPRAAIVWSLTPKLAWTASIGSYNRFPDLETILPLVGNPALHSPTAEHYTLGLKGDVGDNWNWSVEGYVKTLEQLPLALDSTQPDGDQLYSNDVEGQATGVDVLINRNFANNWYGWISLSWSDSERTNTRNAETRPYTLDTPLVLNMVGHYQFNDLWSAGFRFSAKSGEATTKIVGVQPNPDFSGHYLPVYAEPFADRLPTYSRLDIRFERQSKIFGKKGSVYVDVINALNQRNVVGVDLDYEQVQDSNGQLSLERSHDMGLFPSIGFSVTF